MTPQPCIIYIYIYLGTYICAMVPQEKAIVYMFSSCVRKNEWGKAPPRLSRFGVWGLCWCGPSAVSRVGLWIPLLCRLAPTLAVVGCNSGG